MWNQSGGAARAAWAVCLSCTALLACGKQSNNSAGSGGSSGGGFVAGTSGAPATPAGGSSGTTAGASGSKVTPMAGHTGGSSGTTGASGMMMASAGTSSSTGAGGMAGMLGGGGAAGAAGMDAGTTPCSGKQGMLRGESNQMIMSGGMMRTFVYYAPQGIDANTPVPFVFIPHGYLMTGKGMSDITQYEKLADREKIVIVFPDGADTAWNVGNPDCGSAILGILPTPTDRDDQLFMDDVFKFTEADQCIDHKHVFMTGFSMGGYFTNSSGCLRTDLHAIAPHSGGSYDFTQTSAMCKSSILPVLLMHFNGDGLIPTMCGTQARDRWIKRNSCQSDSPDTKMVKGGTCSYYKGCAAGGQVAYCEFTIPASEMSSTFPGHAWSGGSKIGDSAQFAIPDTESATELSWAFFKQYAW